MNSIITNLSDPNWWFTAFFMAIVASVIAGFLKDKIEEFLGNTFSGLRRWRADKKAQRDKIIEAMLSSQMYFTIVLFRMVFLSILTGLDGLLILLAQNLTGSVRQSLLAGINRDFLLLVWNIFDSILGIVVGILTVVLGYKGSVIIPLVQEAIYEFRKRNNLPKLP